MYGGMSNVTFPSPYCTCRGGCCYPVAGEVDDIDIVTFTHISIYAHLKTFSLMDLGRDKFTRLVVF